MNIEITGRHVRVTNDNEQYARSKAEKVAKFLKGDARVEVILDHDHDAFQVEMIVSGHRGPVIVGHVQHSDPRAAVDLVVDKVQHQLRKEAGRRKDHHGESMGDVAVDPSMPKDPEVSYDDIIDEELNQ